MLKNATVSKSHFYLHVSFLCSSFFFSFFFCLCHFLCLATTRWDCVGSMWWGEIKILLSRMISRSRIEFGGLEGGGVEAEYEIMEDRHIHEQVIRVGSLSCVYNNIPAEQHSSLGCIFKKRRSGWMRRVKKYLEMLQRGDHHFLALGNHEIFIWNPLLICYSIYLHPVPSSFSIAKSLLISRLNPGLSLSHPRFPSWHSADGLIRWDYLLACGSSAGVGGTDEEHSSISTGVN